MDYQDYYAVLGVPKTATEKEIRTAYRKLARKYHPDLNPENKEAEQQFKVINEANEVLSNLETRKKYDELGANWREYEAWQRAHPGEEPPAHGFGRSGGGFAGAPGGAGQRTMRPEDLEDLFGSSSPYSDFFGQFFGGQQRPRGPARGRDLVEPIPISLEEALPGTTRTLDVPATTGTRRIEAKIPPGADTGTTIRLAGQGEPGANGGAAGDLYLEVQVQPNPHFERRGADLYRDLRIPLTTSLLGGEVEVPTLTGRVMLKVLPETQDGKVFRLRGQGMPHAANPGERGSLYVETHVDIPHDLTQRQKDLLREFASAGNAQQRKAS
ncbi:MAG TPA: J domain-containing protein [Chloroflexota bacterium]